MEGYTPLPLQQKILIGVMLMKVRSTKQEIHLNTQRYALEQKVQRIQREQQKVKRKLEVLTKQLQELEISEEKSSGEIRKIDAALSSTPNDSKPQTESVKT